MQYFSRNYKAQEQDRLFYFWHVGEFLLEFPDLTWNKDFIPF